MSDEDSGAPTADAAVAEGVEDVPEASEAEACRAASGREARYVDVDTSHLDDVADGCGCAEVWEHTSEARPDEDDTGADAD